MSFHVRLRRLRRERELSTYRLAQFSGLTKQAIMALEKPNANPTLATLNKLAAALGVPIEELVKREAEKPKPKRGNRAKSHSTTF
jgi:transcriptional regulator with XRE-family HTH domain